MIESKQVGLIWEKSFNDLVVDTYERPYVFQQQRMLGQDSIFLFDVPSPSTEDAFNFAQWVAAPPPNVSDWRERLRWEREFYPPFEDLINDLHQRGLIAAGNYALHIWW